MKTTIIYHSADYDGIFCREIARKFLPDAELIGWNFGDALVTMPTEGPVYILDLSPECLDFPLSTGLGKERIVWIDHHKTSIEKFPQDIPGYRIDGVAACRLAWQWFIQGTRDNPGPSKGVAMPVKRDFIDRKVLEPLSVRLAGEYDIWDKRDPDAETFQYALRASPITPTGWNTLLSYNTEFVTKLLHDGRTCQRYAQSMDADLVTSKSYMIQWEGLRFLVLNTGRFNSLTFAAMDKPETGHDALLGYMFNGKCWTVSLYHAKHRTELDLSEIAKLNGGGGHRGSCGFTCTKLPSAFFDPLPSK